MRGKLISALIWLPRYIMKLIYSN